PVHRVVDLALDKPGLEREMALVKIAATGDQRAEALRLAEVFRARVIDISPQSFVFELTGTPVKIDAFVEMMIPIGLVELSRTGVVAIGRGAEPT
ncbi:MAG: acetolactate synthase small subunit, partial [Xanthomonadales bacterium]|nr:acetolactate synthase small subunit [Xanthomonadales bacterium]